MTRDRKDSSRSDQTTTFIELVIRLAVLALLLYWSFVLVEPFVSIVIWSAVLAVALYPVFEWISFQLGGRRKLAATLTTDEIYEAFLGAPALGRTFFHGHTYTGNPLACAAALASLALFERNSVLDNVRDNSQLLERRLAELSQRPHVGDIRQKGIMAGIELVADRDSQAPFAPAERVGHRIVLAARRRGVVIRPLGDVIVLMPAPAMPGRLVDELCTATFAAIDEILPE